MTSLSNIKRHAGTAGQYSVSVDVTYPEYLTFVASVYGGPVVMVTPDGGETFVSSDVTSRLGEAVDEAWVRGFFGEV